MTKALWMLLLLPTLIACGGQSGTTPTDETYTTGDDEPPEPSDDDPS